MTRGRSAEEVEMKNGFRIALGTAALAAGLAFAAPTPAAAQVAFEGSFPAPHGRVSVRFGDPFFGVGTYVPSYYRVIRHPRYGRGFYYRSRWIPVRSYGRRWVVCDAPVGYASDYSDGYYGDSYYDSDAYCEPYVSTYHPYVYSRPYGYHSRGWGHHGGWRH